MSIIPFSQPQDGRELSSWIDYFVEYTADINSPPLFRKWAGIATIAGALERKVWIISQKKVIYPNLYTLLVGPPGSGKTRALKECQDLWDILPDHKVAHTSLTKASLVDALKAAERGVVGHPELDTFNSLLIACGELMNLIPAYDSAFLGMLTDVYDNYAYSEKRRTKDTDFEIKRPQINMIACTTASFLTEFLPEGAFEQGFMSRTIIVYDGGLGDPVKLDLLEQNKPREQAMERALRDDLKRIGSKVGRLLFENDAAMRLEEWNEKQHTSAPKHPRLLGYTRRRMIHLLKLCMVAAVNNHGGPSITFNDVVTAESWLEEVEKVMADIFMEMASGGDAKVMNEAHHWCIVNQTRTNTPTTGARLREFVVGRVPSHNVERLITMMFTTGMLRAVGTDGVWAQPHNIK